MDFKQVKEILEAKAGKTVLTSAIYFKPYDNAHHIDENSNISLNFEQVKNIKKYSEVQLYENGVAIGELNTAPSWYIETEAKENYKESFTQAINYIRYGNNDVVMFAVQPKYQYVLYIGIPIEEGEYNIKPEPTLEAGDKQYKRVSIVSYPANWHGLYSIKPGMRVALHLPENKKFLRDTLITDKSKTRIYGKLNADFIKEMEEYQLDILDKALDSRTYIAQISKVKIYGKNVGFTVMLSYYVEDIETDLDKYAKDNIATDMIPKELFDRKRNKPRYWRLIRMPEKPKAGSIIYFEKYGPSIIAMDPKEKVIIGYVDNCKGENLQYINPEYAYINAHLHDVIYGVILDDEGNIAYATYRAKDISEDTMTLQRIEHIYGKESRQYRSELKRQKIIKEVEESEDTT